MFPLKSFLHTPAKHPVERDLVGNPGKVEGDQSLLRRIERALCIENAQVAVNSLGIARIGETVGFRNSVDQRLLRRYLLVHCTPHGKGIGHFPENRLDCLLVL